MRPFVPLILVSLALSHSSARATEGPQIKDLRVQRVGETTYFHVRLEAPAEMQLPKIGPGPHSEAERRRLAALPQLVPQDEKTAAVYHRLHLPHFRPRVRFGADGQATPPVEGPEFVGKVNDGGEARLLLLFPTGETSAAASGAEDGAGLAKLVRRPTWAEVPVILDFDKATKLPTVANGERERSELAAVWAEGQAARFAVLEAIVPDFGFYGFACAATGRKYGVEDVVLNPDKPEERERVHRQLYETTTGAAAITASLGTRRLLGQGYRDRGQRTVDVTKVQGIDIAEHPWEKMMAGKKPAPEPLAGLVPHDNYYFHFKDIRKLLEFSELIDQWGTNVIRGYEITSRDYQLKERYERQLCIRAGPLTKKFGPAVVRSIAITGNDPYLREGSDLTFLFHVRNRLAFLAAVEPFLQEARKEFGNQLREARQAYQGVSLESYVSPLREVSLHRAVFDDYVVYSNSPVALKRAIDAHQGRIKRLADSLDFQYMRTVFRLDDSEEDGFGFLSDAFIRQLVGPASKIKEKRRLEALTSLQMLTHGAMFTAWETGKLPESHKDLLTAASLRQEDLYIPEAGDPAWDPARRVAVSDAYNTLHFLTPLVELPIDKITPQEQNEYQQFRQQYIQLWRRFFDPVGMRVALRDKRVQMEVYILPLINNSEYNDLRMMTGDGTAKFDVAALSPRTLLQFMGHLSLRGLLGQGTDAWFMIRLDDSGSFAKLAQLWVHRDLHGGKELPIDEGLVLIAQLPVSAAVGGDEKLVGQVAEAFPSLATHMGPATTGKSEYRKTTVNWVRFASNSQFVQTVRGFSNSRRPNLELAPTLYYARIDDGFYAGFSEDAVRELIDQSAAAKEGKGPAKKERIDVNTSLYLSPQAAFKAKEAFDAYLEWETHKRAWPNNAIWYALHRCKLMDEASGDRQAAGLRTGPREAAMHFVGYIPVSPDRSGDPGWIAYSHEARTDEVAHHRHGSLRLPTLHSTLSDSSPVRQLVEQLKSLRVDLRFREDGVHTIVTIDRQ